MSTFSTAISGALVGCCLFSVATSYLNSCANYYHEVNDLISQSYRECHAINQTCIEASKQHGDHTTCLFSAGWQQANERYQFQQRKADKVKYQLGHVVELIL